MYYGKDELKISLKDKKDVHKQERMTVQKNLKNLCRNPVVEESEDDGNFFEWEGENEND